MINKLSFFQSVSFSPYYNLALEEYFLNVANEDEALLYLWQNEDTVVIGRNQSAHREVNENALKKDGALLARRTTGGGAVFHDLGNLNFTFILPKKDFSLQRQNNIIINALKQFNLQVEVSGRNDLLLDSRKFSGHAYLYQKDFCLHHGTLMVNTDLDKMKRYLRPNKDKLKSHYVDSVESRVININDLNSDVTIESLSLALKNSFREEFGCPMYKKEISNELDISKFASEQWIYELGNKGKKEIEKRFDWGGLTLCYKEEEGKMKDVDVYTDALDYTLALNLKQALEGQDLDKLSLLGLEDPYYDDVEEWLNG